MAEKVLQLMGSLNTGGAENLVLDMLAFNSNLPQVKQTDFYVVYSVESEPERIALFSKRVADERVFFIKGGKGFKNTLGFILRLRSFIKRHKIESIHCHNNVDAYLAAMAVGGSANYQTNYQANYPVNNSANTPTIMLTVHGLNLNFNYMTNKVKDSRLMQLFFKLFAGGRVTDYHFLKSMRLTFVSNATKRFYQERYANTGKTYKSTCYNPVDQLFARGEIITNAILPDKLLTAAPYSNLLSELHVSTSQKPYFLMGMVGNFNTDARLQLMICKSLSLLPDNVSYRFVFVGKRSPIHPEYFDDCVKFCNENGLKDKVIFAGARSDVPRILKSLDCYVYGSAADTFGLSVIEAVISGLPVICSDIPALREVLIDGSLGTLVMNTPEAFAYTIEREYSRFVDADGNYSCSKENPSCDVVDRQELALMHYSMESTFYKYYTAVK